MLKVGVVGIGNCGNQVALLAHNEANCDVFAINTSENDLATLPSTIPKKCVGDMQGTGKNRATAKSMLKNSIMELVKDNGEFQQFVTAQDVILVVSSMGGGSGSGMAPLMSNIIRDAYQTKDGNEMITILVGVMPRLDEGFTTQVNALDYMREVYEVLESPTYMVYDNNVYAKETATKVLQNVNKEIVADIKVLQGIYNLQTPYDSIDENDYRTLLTEPGRISIASLYNIKEKDLDEVCIEDLLIDRIKKSAHAELQRDGVVACTGLITNLNERLNSTFDTHIRKVLNFVGEPTQEFLHVVVNEDKSLPNNVIFIMSGLSKLTDRVDKIKDRISEIRSAQDQSQAEVEDDTISGDEIDAMNARRGSRRTVETGSVNLKDIFGKFGA